MHENAQIAFDVREPTTDARDGMDRRVRRTCRNLQFALLELLRQSPYDEISAIQICERANVGRSAFYQDFACKDDLFRTGFSRLEEELLAAIRTNGEDLAKPGLKGLASAFLCHAERHAGLYRSMASGHAGALATRSIVSVLTPLVEAAINPRAGGRSPAALGLRVSIVVNSLLAAERWWLERGAKLEHGEVLAPLSPSFINWTTKSILQCSLQRPCAAPLLVEGEYVKRVGVFHRASLCLAIPLA